MLINANSPSHARDFSFFLLLFIYLNLCFAGDLDLLSEDYEAVDHRLQLFLDVVVFEEEEEEELHSYLKVASPAKLTLTLRAQEHCAFGSTRTSRGQ